MLVDGAINIEGKCSQAALSSTVNEGTRANNSYFFLKGPYIYDVHTEGWGGGGVGGS